MNTTKYLSLLAIAFLSSCATSNIGSAYRLSPSGETGIVSGSLTRDGAYSEYSVFYRQIPGGESGHLGIGQANVIIPYFPKGDFNDRHTKGELFAVELPAGVYEFYRWHVGSGMTSIEPTDPFSIRFRVVPGRATYIGNFHFTQTAHLGLTVTGVKVSYLDMSARDVPLLAIKFPALSEHPVTTEISSGAEVEHVGGSSAAQTTIPMFIPIH